MHKRSPIRPRAEKNHVFVSKRRPIEVYIKRIVYLLSPEGNFKHVHVIGMGAALEVAIEVALYAQKRLGGPGIIGLGAQTGSIAVTDEYEPLVPVWFLFLLCSFCSCLSLLQDLEPQTINRFISQVDVKLYKI